MKTEISSGYSKTPDETFKTYMQAVTFFYNKYASQLLKLGMVLS